MEEILEEVGFTGNFLKTLVSYIKTINYKVLVNGELTEAFTLKCGLTQWDPLSLYLFVMCMENLSQIIECKVIDKDWLGVKVSKNVPKISHVFFADDLILFFEVS